MADLVAVHATPDAVEARLLAAALRGHGLHPTVLDHGLSEIIGAGRHAIPCRVMVPSTEQADARAAIEEFREAQRTRPDSTHPARCPDCGAPWEPGFDECWSCNGEPDAEVPHEWRNDPALRLDEHVDRLSVVVRRPSVSLEIVRAIVVPGIALVLFLGNLGLVVTVAVGLVVFLALSFRRLAVDVDLHALTVGGERLLWEDLREVTVNRYLVAWTREDGDEDERRIIATPDQVAALQRALGVHANQRRRPRDVQAEEAVQRLLDPSRE